MNKIKNILKQIDSAYIFTPLIILTALWVVFAFTGMWPGKDNPYNSFSLQADSWLQGHLNLVNGEIYSYLELAIFNNEYYVSFPPLVSVILLPFVMLMGKTTPDHYISIATTIIGSIYALKIYKNVRGNIDNEGIFLTTFLYVGSNVLVTLINGWVWMIAQNFAFTFTLMAIHYAMKTKGGLSFLFLAFAVGCRPMQALYYPILLYLLWRSSVAENTRFELGSAVKMGVSALKKHWLSLLPTFVVAFAYMAFNYIRFGNIMEFGHNYLPEFQRANEGQFSLSYISENIQNSIKLPVMRENGILEFYYENGINIFLISPILLAGLIALIYSVKEKKDTLLKILLFLTIIGHCLFITSHRTLGGFHFGNRYFNDFLPFVFLSILLFMPKKSWYQRLCAILFVLGVGVNIVGTIFFYYMWATKTAL